MHWWLIMLKGMVLPIMAFAVGLGGHKLFSAIAALDPTGSSDAASWAGWSLNAGFLAALALLALFYWRLWTWERGGVPACVNCDGPLGWVRPGKRYYGKQLSNYRNCYNCGKRNPCED